MDRKRNPALPYLVILVLGLAIAGLLLYILPYRYRLNTSVGFEESNEQIDNPLIGFAPPAQNQEECGKSRLVYIGITWAEWEPAPGKYDIEGLEKKFHIERWKKENKRAVLRFLCDVPGEKGHMDIPGWLYRMTGDGSPYDCGYGAGYSPDYENRVFRDRHAQAITALAEYCNQDEFVAYVELGSLGHWGEWHTNTDAGVPAMPGADICWEYVLDYSDHFHQALLLMRRNYVMVADGGLGIYNDMAGDPNGTEEWLDWIENGGSYETAGEPLNFVPVPGFWENAPAGGELTSRYPMEELLDERLQDTLRLIKESHMSFLGPKCPEGELAESSGAEAVKARLGYRFYISQLRTQFSFADNSLKVYLTWENTGQAPVYWNWPATMYVYDKNGKLKYWETVEMDLTQLMPGEQLETESHIPFTDLFREGFMIGIGIVSPDKKDHIRLAMDTECMDDVQIIYSYEE